ncbi:hypothetical protein DRQ26_06745 [bacterium]|nr:MAG: hypothetical protein DRQ26_06745 [bacterium]
MLSYEQALARYARNIFRWRAFHDLLEAIRLELNPDFGSKPLSTTDLLEWIQGTPGLALWGHEGVNCHLSGRTRDFINIDPGLSGLARCFTLAHELGHFLLGHGSINYAHVGIRRRCELHADLFACTALWPNGIGLDSAKDFLPTEENPVRGGRKLGELVPDEALRGLTKESPQRAKSKARRLAQVLESCHVRSCDEVVTAYRHWLKLKERFDAEGGSGSFSGPCQHSCGQRDGRPLFN